ncbi:lysozyme [Rhizobium sp. BK602]|uniref:lysozyme n=1 Tax=Rhizobium sp. BK602 TaxID=2586986 RepID=UPI0016188AC5|nr:lysozyme [Rhizobium sp. BK602]MBB3608687.1 lysozyme [Rhizobium sp. BK602]
MSKLRKGSTAAAMAVALVGGFEGLRQTAYPDPATKGPPWTVCYGETSGVKRGDQYSVAECKAMLEGSLQTYATGIDQCVKVPLPDKRYVALISFAYNIGVKGACKSSVVGLINAGQTKAGCESLLKYNRAAGVVFPGLTRRRQKERDYCEADL